MAKNGSIVSFTADELAAQRQFGEDRTDWARVDAKTEVELTADTDTDTGSDAAWQSIPENWHEQARAAAGPLVRPQENKQLVSVRYDADVLTFFKGQGRGWQARMNAVLRSFMESQQDKR